jgi:hypothetical protein
MYCLLLAIAALSAGCATLTKGTSQTVTVNTDPSGAMCAMTRDAKTVAVVNSTPGSVPVEKARGTIALLCKKQVFLDAAGTLAAEFQAMTFGNILFGGIIGVVVDAASGAMNRYPESVTITLIPEEFTSIEERDAFFDRMRASLAQEAAEVKERISKVCRDTTAQGSLLQPIKPPLPKLQRSSRSARKRDCGPIRHRQTEPLAARAYELRQAGVV